MWGGGGNSTGDDGTVWQEDQVLCVVGLLCFEVKFSLSQHALCKYTKQSIRVQICLLSLNIKWTMFNLRECPF